MAAAGTESSPLTVAEELCRVFNATKTPTTDFSLGEAGPTVVVGKELTNPGLNDADFELVREFRTRVEDVVATSYWHTAGAYWRFIIARKRSIPDAVAMYREAMTWRADNGIDTLLVTYREPAVLSQYFPASLIGADSDGFPLLVERIGAADLAGLGKAVGPKAFLQWVAVRKGMFVRLDMMLVPAPTASPSVCFAYSASSQWYHERQEAVMRRASELCLDSSTAVVGGPRLRHKMTVIVDLGGIGMRHLGSDTIGVLKRRTGERWPPPSRHPCFAAQSLPLSLSSQESVGLPVSLFACPFATQTRIQMHVVSAPSCCPRFSCSRCSPRGVVLP